MVDREARDRAALLLRRFAAGRLTNDEFDEAYPGSAGDRALPEVGGAAWHLHSDGEVHRLTGEYALARLTRRDVARWVVFLHTDLANPTANGVYRRIGYRLVGEVRLLGREGAA